MDSGLPLAYGSSVYLGSKSRSTGIAIIVKRALSYGAVLWVSRAAHYTDITKRPVHPAYGAIIFRSKSRRTALILLRCSTSLSLRTAQKQ